jgi:hypothetical protein
MGIVPHLIGTKIGAMVMTHLANNSIFRVWLIGKYDRSHVDPGTPLLPEHDIVT